MARKTVIHTWGGFGSQMYALALLNKLQNHNQRRRWLLAVHDDPAYPFAFSSKTGIDIDELNIDIDTVLLNDFSFDLTSNRNKDKRDKFAWISKLTFRNFQKAAEYASRYRVNFDNSDNFELHRFTQSIVGTYTNIQYTHRDFDLILEQLFRGVNESNFGQPTLIHLRLGDLLLINKGSSPIDISQNVLALLESSATFGSPITVISEDPNIARTILSVPSNLPILFLDASKVTAVSLVRNGVMSNSFVGTRSKISFWISAIRILKGKHNSTYVLEEHREALRKFVGHLTYNQPIYYN